MTWKDLYLTFETKQNELKRSNKQHSGHMGQQILN